MNGSGSSTATHYGSQMKSIDIAAGHGRRHSVEAVVASMKRLDRAQKNVSKAQKDVPKDKRYHIEKTK